jgi:hypothetical protein
MQYKEVIAALSQIHTKHINPRCGKIVEVLKVQLDDTVHEVAAVTCYVMRSLLFYDLTQR